MKYIYLFISFATILSAEKYNLRDDSGELRRIGCIEGKEPHVTKSFDKNSMWKMWYLVMGTRSEGVHGELALKGNLVIGKKVYEEIIVNDIVFVWYGKYAQRKHYFDTSGWIPKNNKKYMPSSSLLAELEKTEDTKAK
jgi:hypothetical protein